MQTSLLFEAFRPFSDEKLFLWLMHRFAEVFGEHAILKGGMALRLLDSPRATNDIDYVFVPYSSKKEIVPRLQEVVAELPTQAIRWSLHSTMARADIDIDAASIQLEVTVAPACETIPMATEALAQGTGVLPKPIRVMAPKVALAHKIAAWNERRLLRDLYDIYFLARIEPEPDGDVLAARLGQIRSRLPALRGVRSMTRGELKVVLRDACQHLDDDALVGLQALLPAAVLPGLGLRMRRVLLELIEPWD